MTKINKKHLYKNPMNQNELNRLFRQANNAKKNAGLVNSNNGNRNRNSPYNHGWDEGFAENANIHLRAQIVRDKLDRYEAFHAYLEERNAHAMVHFHQGFGNYMTEMEKRYKKIIDEPKFGLKRVSSYAIAAAAILSSILPPTSPILEDAIFEVSKEQLSAKKTFLEERVLKLFPSTGKQPKFKAMLIEEPRNFEEHAKITRHMDKIEEAYSKLLDEPWFKAIKGVPALKRKIFFALAADATLKKASTLNTSAMKMSDLSAKDRRIAEKILPLFQGARFP